MARFKRAFVSGCYDILHPGHIDFFQSVKEIADELVVCTASDKAIANHKGRIPAMDENNRRLLLSAISCVDAAVISTGDGIGIDFEKEIIESKADCLVVTTDDKYGEIKKALCSRLSIEYVVLHKTTFGVSTTSMRERCLIPSSVPLRVDFAGGWLDKAEYVAKEGYIVNCSITPRMTLHDKPFLCGMGMGTSAAISILNGRDAFADEAKQGCGWQDPAVIAETGLCVWHSGAAPKLAFKQSGDFLNGKMLVFPVGTPRKSGTIAHDERDYNAIIKASNKAREAVLTSNLDLLMDAVEETYLAQMKEGMPLMDLPDTVYSIKYLGAGYGYALALFLTQEERDDHIEKMRGIPVEPYISQK